MSMSDRSDWKLVDMLASILEDARDEPQYSIEEHALMGAGEIQRDYITAEIRRAKAEALRDYADALQEVPDYAPSEYDQGRVDQRHMAITELLERADQIERAA